MLAVWPRGSITKSPTTRRSVSCAGRVAADRRRTALTRQQYVGVERLGDIVVCAQFQTENCIQFPPTSRDKDDWNSDELELLHRFQAIHTGQADIQQHKVGPVALGDSQTIFGSGCRADAIARLLKLQGQTAPQKRVVICHENVLCHWRYRPQL